MRRLGLGTLLIAFNLLVVMSVVVVIGAVAVSMLQRLADTEAIARVELAAANAIQRLGGTMTRLEINARLLAERPTLRRLLSAEDATALDRFLTQFAATTGLGGCAAVRGGQPFASTDRMVPWDAMIADCDRGGDARLDPGVDGLRMWACARLPEHPDDAVIVFRLPDAAYADRLSTEIGLPVRVLDRRRVDVESGDPGARLRYRAVDGETTVAGRVDRAGAYLASAPLRRRDGDVVGILEVALPTAEVDGAVRKLVHTLVLSAAGIGLVAWLVGLVVARRMVRPLERLTLAAARIGRGDLVSPVPSAPGREIGSLARSMEEMRDRVLALTSELRQRRAEAEAILAGIADGVFAVDRERRVRYLNPQAAEMLGVSTDDAIGRFCGDVLRPEGVGGVRPCDARCPILDARFRGSARARETLSTSEGGRRVVILTSTAPVSREVDDGHDGASQFQVIRDETAIEASRGLRDAILANISHEFRTPLSAQLASIEMLRDRLSELDEDEAYRLIRSLERGTIRLTQLIDNLLESTRIEAGRDSIRLRAVRVDEVVEEAVEMIRPLLEQRGQRVSVDLPHPLPPVMGDAPRLVQVLVNLLANANKFSPEGSTVRIGGEVLEREVAVWIEDEGPGLPPGREEIMFDRFLRSTAGEPAPGGMGLGLWIVKSIVERHGGRVEARNLAVGTRVTVVLATAAVTEVGR